MSESKLEWRIYYGDRTTFSNLDGLPAFAPSTNVQAIAHLDPVCGFCITCRHDYYIYDSSRAETWYGTDVNGLLLYLATPGFKVVKLGWQIPTVVYQEILELAKNDPDFPNKSAYHTWEYNS